MSDITLPTQPRLEGVQTRNVAVARVAFDGLQGVGDSKRSPGEPFDRQVGSDLSVGRAFLELGERLVARAYAALPADEPEPEAAVIGVGDLVDVDFPASTYPRGVDPVEGDVYFSGPVRGKVITVDPADDTLCVESESGLAQWVHSDYLTKVGG
jgi:hypothetical protein